MALLGAVPKSGLDTGERLRWFGRQAMPTLHARYPLFFAAHTSTRPFLLTLNDVIHAERRKLYPGATVPVFDFADDAAEPDVLLLGYRSPRRLCMLAEGFVLGAADFFGEAVTAGQDACMLRGDDHCQLRCGFPPPVVMAEDCPSCGQLTCRLGRERRARAAAEAITEQITRYALHDALTGLPDRVQLLDLLVVALERAGRRQRRLGVLFVDLDDFKVVNESLGHATGDRLLEQVAGRLVSCVRAGDVVARLGGDEFVVVYDDIDDEAQCLEFAGRLHQALAAPFDVDGPALVVRASIGVRMAASTERPEALLRDADAAMHAAKHAGKGQAIVFDDVMRRTNQEHLALENDLRLALARGEIAAWFQPVVELRGGSVVGAEALARWHHPTRGQVRPDVFVAVAERSGLILELGPVVLRQACQQAADWGLGSGPRRLMNVNVSAREVADGGLVPRVVAALRHTGLPAAALCLEITERQLVADSCVVRENLRALHQLGVELAIDDFGVEYASLASLRRLPVTTLKVDRSFISGLDHSHPGADTRDRAVVEAITPTARAFGLRTVAEGVETSEQALTLLALGTDQAQGWLFAPAVPSTQWARASALAATSDGGGHPGRRRRAPADDAGQAGPRGHIPTCRPIRLSDARTLPRRRTAAAQPVTTAASWRLAPQRS